MAKLATGEIMADVLELLKSAKPRFFGDLEMVDYSDKAPSRWNREKSFVTKCVACSCGQRKLKLYVTPVKKMSGIFWKREISENFAPLYVECPN